eukprot:715003-Pelagomonas_calceolata.AAC.2
MMTEVAVLLLGGPELILGPGAPFTVFDFHKMHVPLFWKAHALNAYVTSEHHEDWRHVQAWGRCVGAF